MYRTTTVSVVLCLFTATAGADWSAGQPADVVQMPDLSDQGLGVLASHKPLTEPITQAFVADDFQSTSTRKITGIHLWGSWLNDTLPLVQDPSTPKQHFIPDAGSVRFTLNIRARYSKGADAPGQVLWSRTFDPGQFTHRHYADNPDAGWFDPLTGAYLPSGGADCWQYNFDIPEADAFQPQGTPGNPQVYWLEVTAEAQTDTKVDAQLGWNTSTDAFGDPAIWRSTKTPLGGWPQVSPPGAGDGPVDLAFVITPEPTALTPMILGVLAFWRRR